MKRVLLIAITLSLVSAGLAQTGAPGAGECKLTLSQAPSIRGLRLGMTLTEVLAIFPGADNDAALRQQLAQTRFGLISATILPNKYESREKFAGINYVDTRFLDGELHSVFVEYAGPEWKTRDQFVSKVAEAFSLPRVEFWKEAGTVARTLMCAEFAVWVNTGPHGGKISVRNIVRDADKILGERQEAAKDEARRAFKP